MAIKYIAGDFAPGTTAQDFLGVFLLSVPAEDVWKPESIQLKDHVQSVEVITEETKNSLLSKTGWGVIGGLAFGPAGALAGLLLGGKSKEICFACQLKDGRKFIGTADSKAFQKLLSFTF